MNPLEVIWEFAQLVHPWVWVFGAVVGLAIYFVKYRPLIKQQRDINQRTSGPASRLP